MKLTWNPINWIKLAFAWLTSPKAQQEIEKAAIVAVKYIPLVRAFLNSGYVPERVIYLMNTYGVPVAQGLADGSITALDEIKVLVGLAVSTVIKKNEGLSTAAANIARELALLQVKNTTPGA